MLGGSSGLNYMLGVRGEGADYDSWAEVKMQSRTISEFLYFVFLYHTIIARQLGTHPGTIPPSFHTLMRWKRLLGLLSLTPRQSPKITLEWLAGWTHHQHSSTAQKISQLDARAALAEGKLGLHEYGIF